MYAKDLIASRDGNVSVRISETRILSTPTGAHKGFLAPEMIVMTDMDGRKQKGGRWNPSSELKMHLGVYKARPDVCAVVHAHAPYSVAFTLAHVPLATPLIPEVVATLGEIPTVDYTTPTTGDVPAAIAEPLRRHNAMIMERHGTLTVGCDIYEAFDRLETVEHTARIVYAAMTLGQVQAIPADEVARLKAMGGVREFIDARKIDCASCRAAGTANLPMGSYGASRERTSASATATGSISTDVVERIVSEVRKRLA